MTALASASPGARRRRLPIELIGGWEIGLIVFMVLLYAIGAYINTRFFGSAAALSSILRDSARYGVMAVGMTFVIVNKDLDLSVGSIYGLTAVVFSVAFSPSFFGAGVLAAIAWSVGIALFIGFLNGFLVTYLRVPAFIATLTMLFIGRGFVTGLSGGKTISYIDKAKEYPAFFFIGENNAWNIGSLTLTLNNHVFLFVIFTVVGAFMLAKTRMGYQTFATGGNELAASYAGIPTHWVRMRAYLLSAFCAAVAGLMQIAQDRGMIAQSGQGLELVVISAVIVGGASILGGRGRIFGSALGVILVVLIDKVLREGIPTTSVITVDGVDMVVQSVAQLPPGAVPAFLGLILIVAVLIEPWLIRRRVFPRLWARLRGQPLPPAIEIGGIAIEGAQTKGSVASDSAVAARLGGRLATLRHGIALLILIVLGLFFFARSNDPLEDGFGKIVALLWVVVFFVGLAPALRRFATRRDAAAIIITVALWFVGLYLRPDFWGGLDNGFNLLLAFTEVALLSIGLTFVIANGDIDLSVGAVLAMCGAIAAFAMKTLGFDPVTAVLLALVGGLVAGFVNALVTVRFGLPAFVATLGMFYTARGIAAWIVSGRELFGFPENFNLIGRKLIEALRYFGIAPAPDTIWYDIAAALSVQTVFMLLLAVVAGVILGYTIWGQKVYATGGNRRAADYAGINTNRVRFFSLVFSSLCAAAAGCIYIAFYRSFIPTAGQFRELDGIASVIIGGGSIFGGYGTIIGSLAGAAVITLLRALLSLQIITADGTSIVLPQHWVNVFIGLILIGAVLADIWIRQNNLLGRLWRAFRRPDPSIAGDANA